MYNSLVARVIWFSFILSWGKLKREEYSGKEIEVKQKMMFSLKLGLS